ncbi:MAG: PEP-CTERM-box response regulator transcription factor [Deltaproteobacteria bacterium]|nr:PEP-CTERM-box response regulator transcription factor [Deltaproteobacteria bacterium]
MEKPKILIIDDDESIRTQMKWALLHDYDTYIAIDGKSALEIIEREHPSLTLLDLGLPPDPAGVSEGLKLLGEIMQLDAAIKVIVVTGNSERSSALEAISLGAHDFFTKPIEVEELKAILKRAFYVHTLENEHRALQRQLGSRYFDEIVGSCPRMQEVFNVIRKVSTTDVPVLITGESGTGKELVAGAIHSRGIRHDKPFIPINCGAIPESLIESELFGHEKGAFTGAHIQRRGRIEMAHGGTLFLDEVAEFPPSIQVKLLRFLQDHKLERVGGRETVDVDVRVIAATNKEIKKLVETGRFREDLYYRLAVVNVELPPLRERGDDRLLLAKAFLQKYRDAKTGPKSFTRDAVDAINSYEWPGNVRDLENRVRRAITFSEGRAITTADMGIEDADDTSQGLNLKNAREGLEIRFINKAILKHRGNVSKAAEELGVTRPTLHHLIKKYNIITR